MANVAKAVVFLGFEFGSGGRAAVGGPKDGREGLGIAAAILSLLSSSPRVGFGERR